MPFTAKAMTPEQNIFETILARRSVRAYSSDRLGSNTVQTLLEAAIHAPCAMHEEPWAFAIIQNVQILKKLSDLSKPFLTRGYMMPASQIIGIPDGYNAVVPIIVGVPRENPVIMSIKDPLILAWRK
jgi:nitroreductase